MHVYLLYSAYIHMYIYICICVCVYVTHTHIHIRTYSYNMFICIYPGPPHWFPNRRARGPRLGSRRRLRCPGGPGRLHAAAPRLAEPAAPGPSSWLRCPFLPWPQQLLGLRLAISMCVYIYIYASLYIYIYMYMYSTLAYTYMHMQMYVHIYT